MPNDVHPLRGYPRMTQAQCPIAPMSFPLRVLCVSAVSLSILVLAAAGVAKDASEGVRFFESRVRPVLARRCYNCHSGQAAKVQAGLRLDSRAGWLRGGASGPAVVPGDPEKSLLIQAVRYTHPSLRMPPAAKLPDAEIIALVQWVKAGAPGGTKEATTQRPTPNAQRPLWSLQPLKRPPLPPVKNPAWCRTPVDRFVLAKLEAKRLKPSPHADRRTLIRRASFDLTGLPPSPEEVEAFVGDRAPDAWAKVVDRLLASPRYGERWGRHWLDVVHYGDTHGYDKDKRRDQAWPYRDYVIRSFNDDKPYDRFIKEQVAGDVLYPDDPDGIIATGFIAAGPWDFVGHVELREGSVEKEKTRVLDRDDMVANTLSTFNSMTVHCARCHDHKFDPISQRDYYRLQAVFAGVERGNREYPDRHAAEGRAALQARKRDLAASRETLLRKAGEATSPELVRLDTQLKDLKEELARLPRPAGGAASPSNGYHSGIEPKAGVEKWVQVDLGRAVPIDEILLFPARPTDFPDTPGFGFPPRFRVSVSDDSGFSVSEAAADHSEADFPNPGDNPYIVRVGRTARYVRVTALRLWPRRNDYIFALGELQVLSGGRNVAREARVTALDSIEAGRWSTRYLVDQFDSRTQLPELSDPKVAARYRRRSDLQARIQEAERARRVLADSLVDGETRIALDQTAAELAEVERRLQSLPPQLVYSILPRPPRPVWVLARGEVEQRGEQVGPGTLSCVPGLSAEFKLADPANEGSRRAALAEWIASPRNVLTWRSIVNRVWHYHFGRGLVDTPNDFGRNGSAPTHPELLDWLAGYFVGGNGEMRKWGNDRPSISSFPHFPISSPSPQSIKSLHRLIMLSAVYQQSSQSAIPNPQSAIRPLRSNHPQSIDADNRLLWRMNRQRLDAESIRDTVLAVSGKLDLTMGGPGFELFRFKDDHSPVYDHTALEKINSPAAWRRTVYRFTVRSVANPFLECLDCADPNINTPVRNTTLTALQALALLNDPFMVQQAEYFAERLRKITGDPPKQIEAAYRLLFSRPPTLEESTALAAYANKHGLVNTCRLLFNTNEFVFID
jgi:uncharacterized protein DUF1549/uncharacterized protein DUF1553/cytochrome c